MRSIGDASAYTAYQDEAAQGLALRDGRMLRRVLCETISNRTHDDLVPTRSREKMARLAGVKA